MTNVMTRKNKGFSAVLTTLIITVAAVVLGIAVTLFGTSMFQTSAQNQGMSVTNSHIWFNKDWDGTGTHQVQGAVVVRNTGDKLIAVDGIKVRGASTPFGNWYAAKTVETLTGAEISNVETTAQFIYLVKATLDPSTWTDKKLDIDGAGTAIVLGTNAPFMVKQSGPISLEPGKSVVMYFIVPGTVIGAEDVGAGATLTVTAGSITAVQSVTVANV